MISKDEKVGYDSLAGIFVLAVVLASCAYLWASCSGLIWIVWFLNGIVSLVCFILGGWCIYQRCLHSSLLQSYYKQGCLVLAMSMFLSAIELDFKSGLAIRFLAIILLLVTYRPWAAR